jgi:hypothetical protein
MQAGMTRAPKLYVAVRHGAWHRVRKETTMVATNLRCAGVPACLLLVAGMLGACSPMPVNVGPDRVRVEYVRPETFTDIGSRYLRADSEREVHLAALRSHLVQRASSILTEGQSLIVSITDVDMAGSFEPLRGRAGYVRVVRNVYPARIDLHFRLAAADGSVLKEGRRALQDPLFSAAFVLYRDDPLRFEKALFDQWLERELHPSGA